MTLMGHAEEQCRHVTWGASERTRDQRRRSARFQGSWIFVVHNRVALDEIELYAEVLSAVAATDRPLTPAELDEALGIRERGN